MEKIKIELSDKERCLLNNILLENCMQMTDVLRGQKTKDGQQQVMSLIQASMSAQQTFFEASLQKEFELFEPILFFIKPILKQAHLQMDEEKILLIKKGEPGGFSMASAVDLLGKIIDKIPDKPTIISP